MSQWVTINAFLQEMHIICVCAHIVYLYCMWMGSHSHLEQSLTGCIPSDVVSIYTVSLGVSSPLALFITTNSATIPQHSMKTQAACGKVSLLL